jgi:hypothetical protein
MARKKAPGEAKPPKSEGDKAALFVKLAEQRANKALKAIRQLKHLANTHAYSYSEAQVVRVCNTLEDAVKEVRAAFADPKAAKSEGFKL